MVKQEMTHRELIEKARWWLSISKGCNPVFCEKGFSGTEEMPDAIGWVSGKSILVECKTSKSDLLKDKNKLCRKDSKGMGNERYFLLPVELYQLIEDEINILNDGWGIITVSKYAPPRQLRLKKSKLFDSNLVAERDFLRSRILEIQRFGT